MLRKLREWQWGGVKTQSKGLINWLSGEPCWREEKPSFETGAPEWWGHQDAHWGDAKNQSRTYTTKQVPSQKFCYNNPQTHR